MHSKPRRAEEPRVEPSPLRGRLTLYLLGAVAVAASLAVVAAANARLDRRLHVSTDIIGYPVFHAFNPYVYDEQFYLVVLAFPAITFGVLFASIWMCRRLRVSLPAPARTSHDEVNRQPSDMGGHRRLRWVASASRVLLVGAVLGLAAAVYRGDSGVRADRDVAAVALAYAAVLAAGAWLLSFRAAARRLSAVRLHLARANVFGGILSLVGVLAASQVSQVYVSSDRTVHHYPWLPVWMAIAVVGAGMVLAIRAVRRRGGDPGGIAIVERRAVFLVAVPVGLYLLLSSIPGAEPHFFVFESGQELTTLRLVQHGLFPWRDWVTTHGVLQDALQTLLSSVAIQDSNWGVDAGSSLIIIPACLLTIYFLAYRALGGTWPFLVALAVIFFDPGYGFGLAFPRFALWPLLLILLGAVTTRRRAWMAAVLGGALVAQAVLSQETAYCIPAVGLALLGSDASRVDWRRRGQRMRGFAMTLWAAVGGVVVTVVLLLILLSQHALGDFIRFYTAFVPGHALTGGLPRLPFAGYYGVMALVPVGAMLGAIVLLAGKLWLRKPFNTLDWMLLAAAILSFLYYPKFLERADVHVGEAFDASVPLFILLAGAAMKAMEPAVARLWARPWSGSAFRYAVAGFCMVAVIWRAPVSLSNVVSQAPAMFRVQAASEPSIRALGYARPEAIDQSLVSDLDRFLHAYLRSGAHIFDFTNEPGLLYYLLDFLPSTPYYNITPAIREVIQQDVVNKLRADPPLFVVFAQSEVGLPSWDGVPNMVRHYDVAQYLLANYRPFAEVHGQVIYVDRRAHVRDPTSLSLSLSTPLVTADLPFRGSRCDWGYSPNYLSIAPSTPDAGRQPLTVTVTRESPTAYLLTLPPGHQWGDYHWFEMTPAAGRFGQDRWQIEDRPPGPGEQRAITFLTFDASPSTYRFPIGACSQWPAYGSTPLHLTMTSAAALTSVRLLP
jgi:hypothetical protein